MQDVINKLVEEYQLLNLKIDKIKEFIKDYTLSDYHKRLLNYQMHSMLMYLDILELRIEDLKESEGK